MDTKVPVELIATKIFEIRGRKVMLDKDLAILYDVATKNLNKAVKRNITRFPEDFMFQLTYQESRCLRFQNGTSKRGGARYLPYAFTEQGVAMLSSVLNSERAIQVNILIMRAFTRLKEVLLTHKELADRLGQLEKKYVSHDEKIQAIFDAIKQLLQPQPVEEKRVIGFRGHET